MKKYIFIILLFLLAYEAYPQVSLSTRDSVTSFQIPDLFWLQRRASYPSGSYVNKKTSWYALRREITDYIDGLANTWALGQTFSGRATFSSGATFSAATYGTVTFSDSVRVPTAIYSKKYNPIDYTSTMGSSISPMKEIYTRQLFLPNAESNDSVGFSYDDSTLTISKKTSVANLTVTSELSMSDSSSFSGIALSETNYVPTLVSDSVITLSAVASSITIAPPGTMTSPGFEKLNMTGSGSGQILVIQNVGSYSVTLQDNNADGNLNLNSDFTMGQYDIITIKYNSKNNKWYEVARSDN